MTCERELYNSCRGNMINKETTITDKEKGDRITLAKSPLQVVKPTPAGF